LWPLKRFARLLETSTARRTLLSLLLTSPATAAVFGGSREMRNTRRHRQPQSDYAAK
jgi:hypothetical protein